jgi:hypothetical protein
MTQLLGPCKPVVRHRDEVLEHNATKHFSTECSLDENARLGGDWSRLLSAILVIFKVEPEFPVGMDDDCVRRRYMPSLWSQPLGISAFGMGLIR